MRCAPPRYYGVARLWLCALATVLPFASPARAADDGPPQDMNLGSSPDDRQFTLRVTDDAGQPIARARLWLELDHPTYPQCVEPSQRRMAVMHTDTKGIAKLWYPAKPAAIVVTAKGFAARLLRDADLTKQDPFPVRLSPGVPITGRLLMPDKTPAANAEVTAVPQEPVLELFDDFKLAARTDPEGRFELPHAGEHAYKVTARIESAGDAPAHVEPATVTIAAGAGAPAPLELVAGAAASVHGVYISAHEVPVANLEVYAFVRLPKSAQWPTKTGPDGAFAVTGIPPGSRGQISLPAPRGYSAKVDLPPDQTFLHVEGRSLKFDNVPPGRHEGLTVRLLKEATVSGVVTDEQGRAVPGVYVKASTQYLFKTDADGKYEARIPPLEDVTLEISGEGKAEGLSRPTVRAKEGEKLARDFKVKKIDLTPPTGAIGGRVVGADGKPVPAAKVYLGNYTVIPPRLEDAANRRGNAAHVVS